MADPQKPSSFRAMVVYAMPAMDELKRRFPEVNPVFDGLIFKPIKICEKLSRETREVTFEYFHVGIGGASSDEVLSYMSELGLRPALIEEMFAFDAKYPKELMKNPIVALGSDVYVEGKRYLAYLLGDRTGRRLIFERYEGGWRGHAQFLAVRKDV